jgi:hypothetical protein
VTTSFLQCARPICLDSGLACAIGRETFGYQKNMSKLASVGNSLSIETLVWNQSAEYTELFSVKQSSSSLNWVKALLDEGMNLVEKTLPLKQLSNWLKPTVPVINLQQIRDVGNPESACLQRLVTSPLTFDNISSLDVSLETYSLHWNSFLSHPFGKVFGWKSNVVESKLAVKLESSLIIQNGEVLGAL